MENDDINGNFVKISELKNERNRVLFFLTNFSYIDMHMVHKREKCTSLRSHISRVVM